MTFSRWKRWRSKSPEEGVIPVVQLLEIHDCVSPPKDVSSSTSWKSFAPDFKRKRELCNSRTHGIETNETNGLILMYLLLGVARNVVLRSSLLGKNPSQ